MNRFISLLAISLLSSFAFSTVQGQTSVVVDFSSTELKSKTSQGEFAFRLENCDKDAATLKEYFKPYEPALTLTELDCIEGNCDVKISGFNKSNGPLSVRWMNISGARDVRFENETVSFERMIEMIRAL